MKLGHVFGAVLLAATAVPALAAQIAVTSYDLPNGNGQASGGSFNYWDLAYTGSGSTTTDGAALTGGTGDLTDGFSETQAWFAVENGAGTGPYVGWYQGATLNPTVTFNFAGAPTITSILIALDNTGAGGVEAPAAILIDGVATAFTAPAAGTVGTATLTGLSLTGASHTIAFQQNSNRWVFLSEVSFFGDVSTVPEPASWALMIGGFAMVGAAVRRRRAVAA